MYGWTASEIAEMTPAQVEMYVHETLKFPTWAEYERWRRERGGA